MATKPRVGKFPSSDTILWSDDSYFNGFMLVGIVLPKTGSTPRPEVDYYDYFPRLPLPIFARIPIVEGKYNNNLGLFYTADISPPNTRYVAWMYDSTGTQVAGPSATFEVTANPISTLPSFTLTAPVVGTITPTPD